MDREMGSRLPAPAKLVPLLMVASAFLSAPAWGAVDQSLFDWHMQFHLGVTPQVDHHGNLLTLMDFSDGPHLLKMDPNGNTVWDVLMPGITTPWGTEGFLNSGCHIAIDASDNVYVDSFFAVVIFPSSIAVTKVNASGSVAWGGTGRSYAVGGTDDDEHNAAGPMAFGPNGNLYVVGHDGFADPPYPHTTKLIRIDPATGNELSRLNSQITNGTCTTGGNSCVLGTPVFQSTDFQPGMADSVLATDSAGNVYYGGPDGLWSFSADLQSQRWTRTLIPRAVAVDSANGALYMTGVGGGGSLYGMLVARLSTATGSTAWSFSTTSESQSIPYSGMDTNSHFGDDRVYGGNKILLDSTGQIYAAGRGTDGTYHGGIVVKLNSGGTRQWLKHYGPSGSTASVFALTADNMNDIYVSGQEVAAGPSNFTAPPMVIMSPTDGSQLWTQRISDVLGTGLSFIGVNDVVVDGNGNTYWKDTTESPDGSTLEDIWQYRGSAVPDGTYTIVGLNSGMAVDDPGFSTSAGTQMEQYTVNNGSNQKWAVTNLGNNVVRLVNQTSGLSLTVRGGSTTNGAAVEQNVWTGATNQEWTIKSSATPGYFNLVNVKSGQLLDVTGASKTAGALLDQYPANGNANQKWHFQ